jgi:hypothetical protein
VQNRYDGHLAPEGNKIYTGEISRKWKLCNDSYAISIRFFRIHTPSCIPQPEKSVTNQQNWERRNGVM